VQVKARKRCNSFMPKRPINVGAPMRGMDRTEDLDAPQGFEPDNLLQRHITAKFCRHSLPITYGLIYFSSMT